MEVKDLNIKALSFSPYFWWKSIETAIYFSEIFGKELIEDFDFRKWLKEEVIQHSTIEIIPIIYTGHSFNGEYNKAIINDYFFEVEAKNKYGNKVKASSVEELLNRHEMDKDAELNYFFRIDDLTQLVSLYLHRWLLTDSYYDWVKWQMYYDFVVSKFNGKIGGLYQYMWTVVFNQIEMQHQLFRDVNQYKTFRDKLDNIKLESEFIEKEVAELRERKNRVT